LLELDVKQIGVAYQSGDGQCLLALLPAYRAGLYGLEAGDRVQVLYWMHELGRADRQSLRAHPRGDLTTAQRGVFSLRSPNRPNPIGVSEVEILEVRNGALVVAGCDAREGSPLIDIKRAHNTHS
jgi:L-fuculose-phosphate aldolase